MGLSNCYSCTYELVIEMYSITQMSSCADNQVLTAYRYALQTRRYEKGIVKIK